MTEGIDWLSLVVILLSIANAVIFYLNGRAKDRLDRIVNEYSEPRIYALLVVGYTKCLYDFGIDTSMQQKADMVATLEAMAHELATELAQATRG